MLVITQEPLQDFAFKCFPRDNSGWEFNFLCLQGTLSDELMDAR